MKVVPFIAAIAAFGLSAPANAAQELVTNGGFESGNFSGWLQSGITSRTFVCGCEHSGTVGAGLGAPFGEGILSQVITTVPGQTYDVSFWLAYDPSSVLDSFNFDWGGDTRLILGFGAGTFDYSLESFQLIATDTATQIRFDYRNDRALWYLDDVSVKATNAVPEPGTWMLMLLGFGAAGIALRRQRPRKLANAAA